VVTGPSATTQEPMENQKSSDKNEEKGAGVVGICKLEWITFE
jgi:hypothetical protein